MAEKGKRRSEVYNIAHKLLSREIGNKLALRNAAPQFKFGNFQLKKVFDINQPCKIVKIISARSIIFALSESGICVAFDRHTSKRLCYLNLNPNELIRRLYYNEENNSLITVSAHASERFSIKCRTTPLEYIRRAQPDAGFALFENEKLIGHGSVAFDKINGVAITYSRQDHIFKVFELKTYTLLYSISDKEIDQIKFTSGIMLLILKPRARARSLPLKILSIEDGKVLKSFNYALLPNKSIQIVELCHDKILVKKENQYLEMIDVQSEKSIELSRQEFEKPSLVKFLHRKQLLLTLNSESGFVWNLQGELLTSYRNHMIPASSPNFFLQPGHDEELLLCYNKVHMSLEADRTNHSIHIINVLTGNCCAKIGGTDPDVGTSCRNRPNTSVIQSTVQDALEDITAMFYDEEENEIYTGNARGFLQIWSK